ncbi:hypothetical protein ACFX2B_001248 [Malus domestica]
MASVERGFDTIEVETDSKVLVDMIHGSTQLNVVIECLLYDIKFANAIEVKWLFNNLTSDINVSIRI